MVKRLILVLWLCLLVGCSSMHVTRGPLIEPNQTWAVVPFANHTTTPMAGLNAAETTKQLIRAKAFGPMIDYIPKRHSSKTLTPLETKPMSHRQMLRWAWRHKVRYVVTGTVTEWRYKSGIDGEPAVGLSIEVWDTLAEHVVWSAVGSSTGNSRDSLSYVSMRLIRRGVDKIHVS